MKKEVLFMQKILGYMRKAIDNYNMIEDGDKIAVALSGGKDSITMLMGFKNLQRFYPKKFDLIAVSINPGFEGFDVNLLQKICDDIDVPLIVENGHMQEIVFDIRNEKNPCSLCANIRRGMLNSIAIREGCNKIAVGHNEDDVLETFLMNLFYAGSINTFAPISYMDRSKITLIRPLIYAPEKYIRSFVKRNNITVMPKACPMDGYSKREDMKQFLFNMQKDIPNVRANLYGAIKRANINGFKEFK
ncbi:MAG: tRNA 2-thiocytidine biosynthesis protein TtcA [Clostridia bacterium]|nr:tRNA 2-thiocytidine biosynthesis protein TtcA [Clostridia bacterium]